MCEGIPVGEFKTYVERRAQGDSDADFTRIEFEFPSVELRRQFFENIKRVEGGQPKDRPQTVLTFLDETPFGSQFCAIASTVPKLA